MSEVKPYSAKLDPGLERLVSRMAETLNVELSYLLAVAKSDAIRALERE
jgi:hypothetical protein